MFGINNKNKELFFVWLTAVCFSLILLIVVVLVFVILWGSVGHFWTSSLDLVELKNGKKIIGVLQKKEQNLDQKIKIQYKIGGRDFYGFDFLWIEEQDIVSTSLAKKVFLVERTEYGDFYGYFQKKTSEKLKKEYSQVKKILKKRKKIEKKITHLNYLIKQKELKILKEGLQKTKDQQIFLNLKKEKRDLETKFQKALEVQNSHNKQSANYNVVLEEIGGEQKKILLEHIIRYYNPNEMNFLQKTILYIKKFWEFLSGNPRQANTEGGIFPIIFGTVMLVIIMSIFCYPFGLAAAIYLSEYAKENWITRYIRIAVSNLAGVPSIVYGIFGLSFFIYGIGGFIDKFFFTEKLPIPTFGTGGILWASLTLSVLTLPVVIIATEEALNAVPKGIKEGSYALGSTSTQTLFRISLPIALPGIITGFVLAIARAAGEVAPLLITGVVKLAPSLPLDGNFPYLHLDRKFMHLGFHIFDIAFQSPNVEASRPIIFVSTLLLLMIVIILCSFALILREKLRKKYKSHHI